MTLFCVEVEAFRALRLVFHRIAAGDMTLVTEELTYPRNVLPSESDLCMLFS